MQLLWHTFDVVQPIHTDDNFHAIETLLKLLEFRLDSIGLEALRAQVSEI